jgi:glucuronate isomerase
LPRTASAAPFSRSMAPPAPTTATPPRRPPTSRAEAEALFDKVAKGSFTAQEAELFRAQMLTEMAAMSLEDGLVMQIHPGSFRNHNQRCSKPSARQGRRHPTRTDYVHALKPLLDAFGNEASLDHPLHAG